MSHLPHHLAGAFVGFLAAFPLWLGNERAPDAPRSSEASAAVRLNECVINFRPEPIRKPKLELAQDVSAGEVKITAHLEAGFSVKLWDAHADTSEAWTTLDKSEDEGYHYELIISGWDRDDAKVRLRVKRFKDGEHDGTVWPESGTRAMLTLGNTYQIIDHAPLRHEDAGVVDVGDTPRQASRIWVHAHGRLTAFALTSH